MKKEKLRTRFIVIGFLIIIIIVGIVFGMTYSYYKDDTKPSTQVSSTETISTTSDTTTIEIATETSIETSAETSTNTNIDTLTVTSISTDVTSETTATSIEIFTVSSEILSETTQDEEILVSNSIVTSTTPVEESILIQAINTNMPTPSPAPAIVLKSRTVEELVNEVWQGKWGVGGERKKKLEAAGYNYAEVQQAVSKSAKINKISTTKKISNGYSGSLQLVKTFTKGTYYAYGGPRKGGSGRQLIDCSYGGNRVKGSIASWYLYKHYGYNYNGKRTKVYLEISGYPSINGYYYLDDSCAPGYNNVIDFFFIRNGNCPFRKQGVVTVKCYIVR